MASANPNGDFEQVVDVVGLLESLLGNDFVSKYLALLIAQIQ